MKPGSKSLSTSVISILGLVAAFVAIILIVVSIAFLANTVRNEIDQLATAKSDTTQWSLAQTEVEFTRLEVALKDASLSGSDALGDLRRRFDIFYSRVVTLEESGQFRNIRTDPVAQASLADLRAFIDRHVPLFDGPDAQLLAGLSQVESDMDTARAAVRDYSLVGVRKFASSADLQRETIADLLARVGWITFGLVTTLLISVIILVVYLRNSSRAESTLADARNRLQEVLSTSIDGVLAVDIDGKIIDYNGAAERIFGYTQEEALGQDMAELVVPDHMRDAHRKGMQRYLETGEKRVIGAGLLRLEALRKDGTVFPVEVSISSVTSEGKVIFVSYLRDISVRVAAEAELVDARDKAVAGEKAKADLLAVMSHEMRTPLNGLLGSLELVKQDGFSENQRKYLSAMETSANLLLHHVNGVLNISRAETGQLDLEYRNVDPKRLLTELVASQESSILAKGNTVTCAVGDAPENAYLDPLRLRQIALNLIGNANKFTEGGDIVVECELLPDQFTMEIRVIDTGIGIADKDQPRIFEDFLTLDASYTRAAEGTGLGLAISRRLVEAMGGEIGVESEPGEGSLFWVRLPIGVEHARTVISRGIEPTLPVQATSQVGALNVLLVEDNEINRLVASGMLDSSGHQVSLACNGQEGIEIANAQAFDLILMDISMPGVDGITATREIRGGDGPNRDAPIVALTAHALPDDLIRFRDAGVTDTLTKPLTMEALNRTLTQNMRSKGQEHASSMADVLASLEKQVGAETVVKIIGEFCEETDGITELMGDRHALLHQADVKAAAVHKAIGPASVFGLTDLTAALKDIETCLRHGRTGGEAHLALDAFEAAWGEARTELTSFREKLDEGTV